MNRVVKMLVLLALAPMAATALSAATLEQEVSAAAIRSVLSTYDRAIERLDPRGTETLFAKDSQIFESGGSEGNYANYLAHHLTPELGQFNSFKFSNYNLAIRFEGPIALATETYTYRIGTKKGEISERVGVATSVLKKIGDRWQIIVMHSSAHKPAALDSLAR
jgi:ketosteroid isomerase-like protein